MYGKYCYQTSLDGCGSSSGDEYEWIGAPTYTVQTAPVFMPPGFPGIRRVQSMCDVFNDGSLINSQEGSQKTATPRPRISRVNSYPGAITDDSRGYINMASVCPEANVPPPCQQWWIPGQSGPPACIDQTVPEDTSPVSSQAVVEDRGWTCAPMPVNASMSTCVDQGHNYFSGTRDYESVSSRLQSQQMPYRQTNNRYQELLSPRSQGFGSAEWFALGPEAIPAAKRQITPAENIHLSYQMACHQPSTLGFADHDFNMTTLAPSQPQPSGFYSGSTQDVPSVALFRSAGDAAPPTLKRNIDSMDGTQDSQSPVSAASPDAPPGKMRIPALKRPRNDSGVVHNGPISKAIDLKPRPKPGRKPMTDNDDSSDKRKTQNRVAQRNFRDRRAQKCQDLEILNKQLEETYKEAMAKNQQHVAELLAQIATLQAEKASEAAARLAVVAELNDCKLQLQKEREATKSHSTPATQSQRSMLAPHSVSSVHQILTPPSDNFDTHDELEVDFTNLYSRKPSAFAHVDTDDHCGFCSDVENCICRQQEELNNKSLPPIDSSRATTQLKLPSESSAPSFLEAPTNASGPGTCDMCLADPEKARQCRELAEATGLDKNKSIGTVPLRRLNQSEPAKHAERTSCSDFFRQAQQQNVTLRPSDYKRIEHVYHYSRSTDRPAHSPYMEMDAHDAAHALAALSKQDTRLGSISHASSS